MVGREWAHPGGVWWEEKHVLGAAELGEKIVESVPMTGCEGAGRSHIEHARLPWSELAGEVTHRRGADGGLQRLEELVGR